MYPLGTLKVAWIEKDPEYMSSDMFGPNDLKKAVAFGEEVGDYFIMQLISQTKDRYRWKVLPYGNYNLYKRGMKLRKKFNSIFNNDESGFDDDIKLINDSDEKKTQMVRLVDVFFIGPLLIYASTFKALPSYLRVALLLIGIATIVYNGNNYLKNK
jgi:hypothetical protein